MSDWISNVAGVSAAVPDAGPGRARLLAAAKEAEAAEPREAANRVADLMASPEAVRELATAWRLDPAGMTALIMRLGAVRGLQQRAHKLERVIRDAAERQARAEADARWQRSLGQASAATVAEDLRRCLDGHPLPPGLRCPPGWELTPASLSQLRVNPETEDTEEIVIAHRPIVVEGRLRDVDDGAIHLVLGWPGAQGGWTTQVVPRLQVADARQIVALALQDAPINTSNVGQIVHFIADFESQNAEHMPQSRVSSHMGWHGDGADLHFLWGRTVLRRGALDLAAPTDERAPARWRAGQLQLLTPDLGMRALADAFRVAGTLEGWREAVRALLPYPRTWLGLYAALVPALMRFMPNLPNFILDICGETSLGKTTLLRLAASLWGSTDERGGGLLHSWDSSRVFVERASALLDYLPVFLDDTKRARRPEDVGKTLFDFASGIGRGRGSLTGLQRVSRSHGVLLSTGEAPATSFTNDGGTRARTICLWGSPFEGTGPAAERAVAQVQSAMLQHHGHAGPTIVRYLLDHPEVRAGLADELERQHAVWVGRSNGNPVAGRASRYIAAMAVAKRLLHEVLRLPLPVRDPLLDAWEAVKTGASESDRATDALREVLSWATSQQHRFYGRIEHEPGSDQPPPAGWLGAWAQRADWKTLAILPSELKGFLGRQGYDAEAVLRSWRDRSWLLVEEEHQTRKVMVGTRKSRCFVLKREAVEAVAGAE